MFNFFAKKEKVVEKTAPLVQKEIRLLNFLIGESQDNNYPENWNKIISASKIYLLENNAFLSFGANKKGYHTANIYLRGEKMPSGVQIIIQGSSRASILKATVKAMLYYLDTQKNIKI